VAAARVAEKMKPVLRYAQKLTREPDGVTETDADAVLAAGWDETALYHAVAVTALFNFMIRLVEGLGIELDAAYVKPAAQRLADRGYLPLIDIMKG
jgi:alkylhydroperoxidase family enzyme